MTPEEIQAILDFLNETEGDDGDTGTPEEDDTTTGDDEEEQDDSTTDTDEG